MTDIYQYDTGTIFHYTVTENGVAIDISTATGLTAKFKRKDKTTFSRTATFETDGTDGKLVYTTTASDLDQTGKWTTQLFLEMPAWTGHTSTITFDVLEPIIVAP